MDKMIAYCGLICTECPAYLGTQTNDREALEKLVVQWREEYNAPDLTVDSVLCDGCLATSGRLNAHCAVCEIRACGIEHKVANCAHCQDFACEKIEGFFAMVPEARLVLDTIHSS